MRLLLRKPRVTFELNLRCSSTAVVTQPKYPPIQTDSRKNLAWKAKGDKLRRLPTYEEKSLELNIERYYGHICYKYTDDRLSLKTLEHVKFLTRSNVISGWPHAVNEDLKKYLPTLKRRLKQSIAMETELDSRFDDEKDDERLFQRAANISQCVHRALTMTLSPQFEHLAECSVDLAPRQECFWFCGGVPPFQSLVQRRRHFLKWDEDRLELPITSAIHQSSQPTLQLRYRLPLPPAAADLSHPATLQGTPADVLHRAPPAFKCQFDRRYGVNVCGVWPGTQCTFVPLFYSSLRPLQLLLDRSFLRQSDPDYSDFVSAHGCLTAFGVALSQAAFNGFFPYTALTYPITTHCLLTDGQRWHLFAYQLNTIEQLHQEPLEGAPANMCWISEPQQLWSGDSSPNEESFNDQLLLRLLEIYALAPSAQSIQCLQPYLDAERSLDRVENESLRTKYLETFFHVLSNRPRHRLMPEVYLWEKIYKVRHKTRPQDAGKRFFEKDINPYERRLDEFHPKYIPKALKPQNMGKRWKRENRFEKNVFHEMDRLRGLRNDDPEVFRDLQEIESWRDQET